MLKNLFEILHSSMSVLSFIAIIGLSAFTVMALNPVAMQPEETFIGPEVAGLTTNNTLPLSFINISEDNTEYKTVLKLISDRSYEYSINFDNLSNKEARNKFIKIRNTSQEDASFTVETIVPESLKNQLTIKIRDNNDQITLSKIGSREPKVITLEALSERSFDIEMLSDNPINYSFSLTFLFVD